MCRVQQLMLGNTVVKLAAVFASALPIVLIGGEVYAWITGDPLFEGFLKIFSVLYIIPGAALLHGLGRGALLAMQPGSGWRGLQE